jgi:hypothetical protein
MRKIVFVSTAILLLSLLTVLQVVEVVDANPLPPSWMHPKMTITIQSPLNGTNNVLPVLVKFTAQSSAQFSLSDNQTEDWNRAFFYVIDDGQNMSYSGIKIIGTQMTETSSPEIEHQFSGQAYLTNLTDGIHSITVYWGVLVNVGTPAEFIVYDVSWSATSQFYVGTEATPSPALSSLTPQPTIHPTQSDSPFALMDAFYASNIPLAVGCLAVIVAVALVSLVHFQKLTRKKLSHNSTI